MQKTKDSSHKKLSKKHPFAYLGQIANQTVAQKFHRRLDVIVIVLGVLRAG